MGKPWENGGFMGFNGSFMGFIMMHPLVMTNSLRTGSHGPVEIRNGDLNLDPGRQGLEDWFQLYNKW